MASSNPTEEAVSAITSAFNKDSSPSLDWMSYVKWFLIGGIAALIIAYTVRYLAKRKAEREEVTVE